MKEFVIEGSKKHKKAKRKKHVPDPRVRPVVPVRPTQPIPPRLIPQPVYVPPAPAQPQVPRRRKKMHVASVLRAPFSEQARDIMKRRKLTKSDLIRYLLNVETEYRKLQTEEGRLQVLNELAGMFPEEDEQFADVAEEEDDEYGGEADEYLEDDD